MTYIFHKNYGEENKITCSAMNLWTCDDLKQLTAFKSFSFNIGIILILVRHQSFHCRRPGKLVTIC